MDSPHGDAAGTGTSALDGLRVLDLTRVLAGPYAAMILCDLGAEVVKVERPPHGDVARTTGPFVNNESIYFQSVNRGKRSISIDLRAARGRELFLRLVDQADVLMENFTPGKMAQLGLGAEALLARNPRLIYASTSGFGQTGPLRERPALDIIVQGMGGVMSITGYADAPPARPGTSIGDITAGLYTAVGILAALRERESSGCGQSIDISMLDCQIAILENAVARWYATGREPGRLGTRHPSATPFQAFPTADGWMVLALAWGVENQWELFCAELGLPEVEIRTAWGKNVLAMSDDEIRDLKSIADRHGRRFICVASPVYKCVLPNGGAVDERYQHDAFQAVYGFDEQHFARAARAAGTLQPAAAD